MISKYRLLKTRLLSLGVSITDVAMDQISREYKAPTTARTGLANGLEIVLPSSVWVNTPIDASAGTPFQIDICNEEYGLYSKRELICRLSLPKRPGWYQKSTSNGIPATKIGTLRGDRLSIALYKDCTYFDDHSQCRFCAIKHNPNGEPILKDVTDVIETVEFAIRDSIVPTDHIYFNLGNTRHLERGLHSYETILQGIRKFASPTIHLNQTTPRSIRYIRKLHDIGFNEVSFNVEVYDEAVARDIMPGKHKEISLSHCLKMLEAAVEYFGIPNVSSCLIVGLEDPRSTVRGVEELMKRGVIPKLSVFRPLIGSGLAHAAPPPVVLLEKVLERSQILSSEYGIPLGPLCNACKMLSLT